MACRYGGVRATEMGHTRMNSGLGGPQWIRTDLPAHWPPGADTPFEVRVVSSTAQHAKSVLTGRYGLEYYYGMNAAKITISLSPDLLKHVDLLVQSRIFPNRSQAIQAAVQEKIARLKKTRLATECAKLDVGEEQSLADLGLPTERDQWPPD